MFVAGRRGRFVEGNGPRGGDGDVRGLTAGVNRRQDLTPTRTIVCVSVCVRALGAGDIFASGAEGAVACGARAA